MNEHTDILRAIPELEPDIPAESFAGSAIGLTLGIAGGIILLLALAATLWWRYRHRRETPPPLPKDIALAAIDKLEAEAPPLRECSLQLSLILRGFLSGQALDPALYETHEEFSHRMDSLASVPASCQYDTRCLLENLAEQKYVAESQDDARLTHRFLAQGRELVQRIADAQAAEAAARDADEDPRP